VRKALHFIVAFNSIFWSHFRMVKIKILVRGIYDTSWFHWWLIIVSEESPPSNFRMEEIIPCCYPAERSLKNCVLLGYYTASTGNLLPTFCDNLSAPRIRPICCPETSVRNYHYSRRNDPEERSSQLFRGGSLKSRIYRNLLRAFSQFRVILIWCETNNTRFFSKLVFCLARFSCCP
jgi:hypothetical protein